MNSKQLSVPRTVFRLLQKRLGVAVECDKVKHERKRFGFEHWSSPP